MKIKKGDYGYRNHNRRMRLGLVIVFGIAIMAQLGGRLFVADQATKNILTVMSVLTVLPMANMASPLLASWKYKTPSEGFYQKVKVHEASCTVIYDLIITSKDMIMPMDAVAVHPTGLIGYCSSNKVDCNKAESFLKEMLSGNRLEIPVKIIKEEITFLRRLETLKPADQYDDDGSTPYVVNLLKNLSM